MSERLKRVDEVKKIRAGSTVSDMKFEGNNKYDAEIGAIEIPNEIPDELKTGRGKVICTDTAEGVVGDVSDPEKDPMSVDKKY